MLLSFPSPFWSFSLHLPVFLLGASVLGCPLVKQDGCINLQTVIQTQSPYPSSRSLKKLNNRLEIRVGESRLHKDLIVLEKVTSSLNLGIIKSDMDTFLFRRRFHILISV